MQIHKGKQRSESLEEMAAVAYSDHDIAVARDLADTLKRINNVVFPNIPGPVYFVRQRGGPAQYCHGDIRPDGTLEDNYGISIWRLHARLNRIRRLCQQQGDTLTSLEVVIMVSAHEVRHRMQYQFIELRMFHCVQPGRPSVKEAREILATVLSKALPPAQPLMLHCQENPPYHEDVDAVIVGMAAARFITDIHDTDMIKRVMWLQAS